LGLHRWDRLASLPPRWDRTALFTSDRNCAPPPAAGKLWAINRDGSRKWSFDAPDWIDFLAAVGNDGSVYFGCWDGVLYALGSDGRKRWEYRTDAFIFSSPAVSADGAVCGGRRRAIARGRSRWQVPLGFLGQ
jgi:outer membrane protein assembly factor BamB